MPLYRSLFAFAVTASLFVAHSQADDLETAANDLCEKIRTCTLAEIEQQELTPEMQAMMEPMLENMCVGMRQGVDKVPLDHELYEPAVACMRSMAELSCVDLRDGNKVQTAACATYQDKAMEMYGPE